MRSPPSNSLILHSSLAEPVWEKFLSVSLHLTATEPSEWEYGNPMQLTSAPTPLTHISDVTRPASKHVSLEIPLCSDSHSMYSFVKSSIGGNLNGTGFTSSMCTTLLFLLELKSEFTLSPWPKLTLPFASQWWHRNNAWLSLTLTDKVLCPCFFLSGPHSGHTTLISLPYGSLDIDEFINLKIESKLFSLLMIWS